MAYGRLFWTDRNEGGRGYEAVTFIDPAWTGRGVEDALLAIGEARQLELAREQALDISPAGAFLSRSARGAAADEMARLEAAGYTLVRRFAELARPDFEAIPDFRPPAGIELRRVDPADPTVVRRAWDVAAEAFADSWGDHVESEADTSAGSARRNAAELFCIAFDIATGEVARPDPQLHGRAGAGRADRRLDRVDRRAVAISPARGWRARCSRRACGSSGMPAPPGPPFGVEPTEPQRGPDPVRAARLPGDDGEYRAHRPIKIRRGGTTTASTASGAAGYRTRRVSSTTMGSPGGERAWKLGWGGPFEALYRRARRAPGGSPGV